VGGLGENIAREFVGRIGLALGFVIGIALLGALALTTAPDVNVIWYDDRGRIHIGIKRLKHPLRDKTPPKEVPFSPPHSMSPRKGVTEHPPSSKRDRKVSPCRPVGWTNIPLGEHPVFKCDDKDKQPMAR